jgi:hypothetical protein
MCTIQTVDYAKHKGSDTTGKAALCNLGKQETAPVMRIETDNATDVADCLDGFLPAAM